VEELEGKMATLRAEVKAKEEALEAKLKEAREQLNLMPWLNKQSESVRREGKRRGEENLLCATCAV
jgi:hypothetical protein